MFISISEYLKFPISHLLLELQPRGLISESLHHPCIKGGWELYSSRLLLPSLSTILILKKLKYCEHKVVYYFYASFGHLIFSIIYSFTQNISSWCGLWPIEDNRGCLVPSFIPHTLARHLPHWAQWMAVSKTGKFYIPHELNILGAKRETRENKCTKELIRECQK